jgi:hypothetical protein
MTQNFDGSLAVPSTEAALAEFRARPMHPERAAQFGSLSFGVLKDPIAPSEPVAPEEPYRAGAPAAPGIEQPFGSAEHRRLAREIGLVRLGACFEGDADRQVKKEVWGTRDGAVYASFSDPDRYHLGTYFDDGSCQLTWSHASPRTLTNPGSLVSTGGTGNLRADLASHVARVKDALDGGRHFLRIDDIEISVELSRHYYRHVAPLKLLAENEQVRQLNKKGRRMLIGVGVIIIALVVVAIRGMI